jgi:hypothetical protein
LFRLSLEATGQIGLAAVTTSALGGNTLLPSYCQTGAWIEFVLREAASVKVFERPGGEFPPQKLGFRPDCEGPAPGLVFSRALFPFRKPSFWQPR